MERFRRWVGTHTHVQTADEKVLPGGTAYITDVGFCGAHDSVIGREKSFIVDRFRTLMPVKMHLATGGIQLDGVVIDLDEETGKATADSEDSTTEVNRVEPLSVSALTAQIKEILEDQVGEVSVQGEISNLRHQSSGHYYFTLKDEGSQIPCALFKGSALRLGVQPQDGAKGGSRGGSVGVCASWGVSVDRQKSPTCWKGGFAPTI